MAQAMDFYLRCNSLKCRSQLKERAVVTTCSHIFCLPCADKLGLSHPTSNERRCPACQTVLLNPDDAVSTVLNPTEDYKTSVLSGLDPNTIMECAGRALVFWAYQTTQEVFYQEFLGKTLTEKYTNLSTQMDKIILNANSEISTLQNRITDLQQTTDALQKKSQVLGDLYKDKCRKFNQITNLYNILKTRAMRSQMQTAASDTVSQTLNSLSTARNHNEQLPTSAETQLHHQYGHGPPFQLPPQTPASRQSNACPVDQDGVEQLHRYQRSGTGSSKRAKKKFDTTAMPPPSLPVRNPNLPTATPQHRTRLPAAPPRSSTRDSSHRESSLFQQRFGDPPPPSSAGYHNNSFVNHSTSNRSSSQGYAGHPSREERMPDRLPSNGTFAGGNTSGLRSTFFENPTI